MTRTVNVCPERDIVCGDRPSSWCDRCPKAATLPLDHPFFVRVAQHAHALEVHRSMLRATRELIIDGTAVVARAWHQRAQQQARPEVTPLPLAGLVMVRGYPCRLIDQPTEAELRAIAHALTVQADRMACERGDYAR